MTVAIVGGGPIGCSLALLLAARGIASHVFDARALADAVPDRRLLALSRGTLRALAPLALLPTTALAPIRQVLVTSAGEFGRVVIDDAATTEPLGATLPYGVLLGALAAAVERTPLIQVTRPCSVERIEQQAQGVQVRRADGTADAAVLAVHAEGLAAHAAAAAAPVDVALWADLEVSGLAAGAAIERFTRDGPLALLPLAQPVRTAGTLAMSLVWCMPAALADARAALDDRDFVQALQQALGPRLATVRAVARRGRTPLAQATRATLVEHRVAYVGNAAQALHPVAGQGFNLGLRDCVMLADALADALSAGRDPVTALEPWARARRADRLAIAGLTRTLPALFASRLAPAGWLRSAGLTALAGLPVLRAPFAHVLMFGVRA